MRWSPGPISKNIEDRRAESLNPELMLGQARVAAEWGDPDAQVIVPWWMDTRPHTQETLLDDLATQRALERLSGAR